MKHHMVGRISGRSTLRFGGSLLLASTAALAVACGGEHNPTSPSIAGGVSPSAESSVTVSELPGGESSSTLAAAKTTVCHLTGGTNEFVISSVADDALQSHLDHGDVPYSPVSLAGATFSSSLHPETARFAFDGSPTTFWSAEQYFVQYLEIDFGSPQSFWEITALVSQSPSGATNHQVTLDGSAGFSWTGVTSYGDLLKHRFGAKQTAQKVRITTTQSPSWVAWSEIQFPPCPSAR